MSDHSCSEIVIKYLLTMTNIQRRKTCWNCEHMVSFRCLALVWVIWPVEKSNTSSDSNLRMTMLFWHIDSLVLLAPTMSGMNDCQFLGHSLFRICLYKLFMTVSLTTSEVNDNCLCSSHICIAFTIHWGYIMIVTVQLSSVTVRDRQVVFQLM